MARAEERGSSQDMLTCTMVTVFCDIFAHSLIALSDDKFLIQYTNVKDLDGDAKKKKVVMAERVIEYLRDLLYEVYWSKPVLLDDVKLASSSTILSSDEDALRCMRARFLLSGTKLWGSLYERWCRLVRSIPFCDESAWWFPHLASQEGGNAVVNAAAQRSAGGDPNGLMDMDVDEESEDEEDGMDESQTDDDNAANQGMSTADAESDALANAFRDPKMARVLTCIPQALPFERRVRLFDSLLTADKLKTQDENAEFRMAMLSMMRGEENVVSGGRERVEIRRDKLYDDSMRQLNQLGSKLKKKVQVSFVNQHGTQEAGIDGGGVFKEFLDDLIKDAFSKGTSASGIPRLFTVTPLETLKVNSALTQDGAALPHYEFLGRVLGKAVYESILVDPQFSLPFLNQLLGKRNSLEDLKNDDFQYYTNLTKLLTLKENEIEELGLTFEITLGDGSSMRTVELLPGGRSKAVTKANVIQYVHLVSHQRLNVEAAVQTKSFLNGFRDLIPASWVRLFSAYELQKLISGDDSLRGFDVASLKRSMQYAAGYHLSQPVMQWFWEVLEDFTPEQQRKFLRFMTSCSRQPLLGFSSLDPPPCVQQIRLPDQVFEDDLAVVAKNVPLPTSSTCMNLLKLPNYRNKELLRKKLLDAVESGAGFELT
ncbi:Probable E3 ubiquitin-protein ligase hulA [Seminavis robusta]|uniref:HECT-type E3 ubiquitin transferase n=1 Tax=Seminavis robusta TaxID=568900 RepID=A0A9N8E7E9_9STRA|nr:Probable E3 ubiquitin-protein ligase hulA [Seminavis robusta]|eukprot:Sro763_g198860.1 Probable E3 ubiquitin-protein ligase hulA (654) ;mRNA; r:19382-21425